MSDRFGGHFLGGLLLALVCACGAWGATFTVNDQGDAGDAALGDGAALTAGSVTTLRAAFEEANALGGGPHTVNFSNMPFVVNLGSPLNVNAGVNIEVLSTDAASVRVTQTGGNFNGFFRVAATGRLLMALVTISGGTNSVDQGGAFHNLGTLVLDACIVDNNSTPGGAGFAPRASITAPRTAAGPFFGGAVYNTSSATFTGTTFSNNQADEGGAIYNETGATLSATNCTFNNNAATVLNGGAILNALSATGTVTGGIFNGNTAQDMGGAIANLGAMTVTGGVAASRRVVVMPPDTFAFNAAGGKSVLPPPPDLMASRSIIMTCGGAVYNTGTITLTSMTFTGNTAGNGGAICNDLGGIMTIAACTLDNSMGINLASTSFGGGQGGGIFNAGTLTATGTLIQDCQALDPVPLGIGGQGGGLFNSGTATLSANCDVDNNLAFRKGGGIFNFFTGATLNVSSSSVTNNDVAPNDASMPFGGGVAITGGTVTLTDCDINGNTAINGSAVSTTGQGGGIASQGATLTILRCDISNNVVDGTGVMGFPSLQGGGVFVDFLNPCTITDSTISGNGLPSAAGRPGAVFGGGLFTFGDVDFIRVTVDGNQASIGGGINNGSSSSEITLQDCTVDGNVARSNLIFTGTGGGIANTGTLTMNNTTVSNNAVQSDNDGFGSALFNANAIALTNCTISGNSFDPLLGGLPGPLGVGAISHSPSGNLISPRGFMVGPSTVVNCTIVNNVNGGITATMPLPLLNTICALNGTTPDVSGPFTSNGGNLIGDVGTAIGLVNGSNGDQVGGGGNPVINPLLGLLQDNGGLTFTHAPLLGSPAIDRGIAAGAPATDQRGIARPKGLAVDVGAVESTPPTVNIVDVTPDPRANAVTAISIVFSEAIGGFNLADLTLTLGASANLLTAAQTLTTSDNITWTLGNLAGITDALGTYTLTLAAAGSGITSSATGFALAVGDTDVWQRVSGNNPPVVIPPTWIPDPPETGTPIELCADSTDPDNDALTYTWDFGDGTTATGHCVTHIWVNPGVYDVTVTVNDGTSSVSSTVKVPVGNRFGLLNLPIRIQLDGVTLRDQYKVRGRLTLPGGFSPAVLQPGGVQASGRLVTLDVGGVIQVVQLDTRGKGTNAQGNFTLKRERRGTWIFNAYFKGGTFSPNWTDNDLVNGDFRRKLVFMPVVLTVSGVEPFAGLKPLQYTARRNAMGKTTNRR